MSDANLQAVFFDFDGVICQTEVCRLDALEVRLHALGLHPDRRGLYRMVSGGLGSREAAMMHCWAASPFTGSTGRRCWHAIPSGSATCSC